MDVIECQICSYFCLVDGIDLGCGHSYHQKCLRNYFRSLVITAPLNCPQCGDPIPAEILASLLRTTSREEDEVRSEGEGSGGEEEEAGGEGEARERGGEEEAEEEEEEEARERGGEEEPVRAPPRRRRESSMQRILAAARSQPERYRVIQRHLRRRQNLLYRAKNCELRAMRETMNIILDTFENTA